MLPRRCPGIRMHTECKISASLSCVTVRVEGLAGRATGEKTRCALALPFHHCTSAGWPTRCVSETVFEARRHFVERAENRSSS